MQMTQLSCKIKKFINEKPKAGDTASGLAILMNHEIKVRKDHMKQRNLISADQICTSLSITMKQWMASRLSTAYLNIANNLYYDVPDLLKRFKIVGKTEFPLFWQNADEVAYMLDKSPATILRWARQKKIRSWKFGPHTYRFHMAVLTTNKRSK